MKDIETVQWGTRGSGHSYNSRRRHLRYAGATRTICRIAVPKDTIVVSGEATCSKCLDQAQFKPWRTRINKRFGGPTREEVAKEVRKFIKDGGVIRKIQPGGASMLDEEDTT